MNQKQLFFSIVIPAHNEENYISETLNNIKSQNYPVNCYETVVVENGSTDKTFDLAKKFESEHIQVYSSTEKGVSKARNFGIQKIKTAGDWVVVLDADTVLKSEFLNDLNTYLQAKQNKNYAVGTTKLLPTPDSKKARLWFAFYDLCHKLFKVTYSIQIYKRSILNNIRYDESMTRGEDLKLIKEALKFGQFFFLNTQTVHTSTRRFEQVGWWKLFVNWTVLANLPYSIQKKFDYEVTR